MLYMDALRTYDFVVGSADWRSAKAKMQRRDRKGRFAEMGGGFTFDFTFPDGRQKTVTGKIVGISGTEDVDVEIKGDSDIPDGVYSVPSTSGESSKAVLDLPAVADDDDWFTLPSEKPSAEKAEPAPDQSPSPETQGYSLSEAMKPLEEYGAVSSITMDDALVNEVLAKVPDLADDTKFDLSSDFSDFDKKAQEIWTTMTYSQTSQNYIQALDEFYSFADKPATDDMPAVAKKIADSEYIKASDARDRHARAAISSLLIQKKRELASTKSSEQAKADAEALVEKVKSQPVVINYHPGSVSLILDSGRVKSQFETGEGTWFDPEGRAFSEAMTSGLRYDTPDDKRPIYGTIATEGADSFTQYTRAYGGVRLVLKDSVKDRSTVTAGDSFERRHIGSPARNPDPTLFPKADQENGYQFYVEAQILGGLPVEDIEELYITDDGASLPGRNEELRTLIEKADSLGIKMRFASISEDHKTSSLSREDYMALLDSHMAGGTA